MREKHEILKKKKKKNFYISKIHKKIKQHPINIMTWCTYLKCVFELYFVEPRAILDLQLLDYYSAKTKCDGQTDGRGGGGGGVSISPITSLRRGRR